MLMGSRRLLVTVFVICTSCLCLCSVLTYLLHPLSHFLSCPHLLLGCLLLMLHVKQLPLDLGAKYAERPPCGVQLHQHKVCTDTF
jgi:hypothetical protein